MGRNKSLFKDEQYFLERKRRTVRFNDDMDLDLFPLYHSRTKAHALYRFFDGNALYKEVINEPIEYYRLCKMFDLCEPDEFIPSALSSVGMAEESIVRDRCNFSFEIGFTKDGSLHTAPSRFASEYSESDDEEEKLYPNQAYTEDIKKVISNRAFSALALKFLEATGNVPDSGEFVFMSVALVSHTKGTLADLPVHKDSGNTYIGTTLIRELALEGAKSGVYVAEGKSGSELITSDSRKTSAFGVKETVGCIDSIELKSPLDMLVINNKDAFHDVSRFSCKQRQVCIFSIKGEKYSLDHIPFTQHRVLLTK